MPFKFPAAVEFYNVSPFSDALADQRLWTSPAVLVQRNTLLGSDGAARLKLIQQIRSKALIKVKKNLKLVEQEERIIFRIKSLYFCREGGISMVSSDDDGLVSDVEQAYMAAANSVEAVKGAEDQGAKTKGKGKDLVRAWMV